MNTFKMNIDAHLIPFIYNGVDCAADIEHLSQDELDFINNSTLLISIDENHSTDAEFMVSSVTGLYSMCYQCLCTKDIEADE